MRAYIIRRLLLIIPTFIGISIVTFALIQLAPGSPIAFRLQGMEGTMKSDAATQEIIEQTKELYGLDKPVPVQYILWLGRLVRLDFGDSMKDQRPVIDKIGEALPITLQFNLLSLLLVYLISIPIGVYSATHPGTVRDSAITLFLFIIYSMPAFWVAMLLILFLGGGEYLDWFPIHGLQSRGAESFSLPMRFLDRLWHMALPLFCMTYGSLAFLSRYMRAGMLEVMRQDYIRTARAYGFSERTVIWKYAMRNSLIAIITLLGGLLPALIGGSIIIESIFSIPGMGRLAFEAVLSRDYPLIMGNVAMASLLTLAGLLLSDLLYVWVDPRIKLG
ncbi:MAG: ABC transporter permease [Candidatus Hydrogenedentes bacterium]|nr:ABC transporter permease [Candidatus Hydrogenedentota bacterium]